MRKKMKVLGVVVLAVVAVTASYYIYRTRHAPGIFNRLLTSLQSSEKRQADEQLAEATQDVEGGLTPEETLVLYIQAVEEQDYARASRYFIAEKQSEEFMNILGADRYTILKYLEVIKKPHQGTYSDDQSWYTARYKLPGPDFFARFRKYPNARWKIIEI